MPADAADQDIEAQISAYIDTQSERKRSDMLALHTLMRRVLRAGRLWFLDGTDESGRTVSNPSIGYGVQQLSYVDGSTRAFYQLGLSANTSGISVYVMGLADRGYLKRTYAETIGAATVTGYCIKFRALQQVDVAVLEAALRDGVAQTAA